MQEFATKAGDELFWSQPAIGTRYFELTRGEEAFGTLEFRSLWGTLAVARNPIQDWSFKRLGFMNPHVTIRHPEADSDYALFFPKVFGGGTLQLLDGRPFGWEPVNFWRTRWHFSDKHGAPIISFDQGSEERRMSEFSKLESHVKIESSHITNQEFSLMVTLGFYLMALYQADAAAAGNALSS